jgi:hypothetical protein
MAERLPENREEQWGTLARRQAERINVGWWLRWFCPAVVMVAVGFSGVVLVLRLRGWEAAWWEWLAGGAGLLVAAGWSWVRSKPRFVGEREVLILLEDRLELSGALSAARAGVVRWPGLAGVETAGVRLDWRVLLPLAGSLLLMVGARSVSVPAPVAHAAGGWREPLVHAEIREVLKELEGVAAPDVLREYGGRLGALGSRGRGEQYGHDALEAAEHLLATIRADAGEQGLRLERLAGALESRGASDQADAAAGVGGAAGEAGSREEALRAMLAGPLGLGGELGKSLGGMDGDALRGLDGEAAQALRDRLRQAAEDCRDGAGGSASGEAIAGEAEGGGDERADTGSGPPGRAPGRGAESAEREEETGGASGIVPRGSIEVVGTGQGTTVSGTQPLGERVREAEVRPREAGLLQAGGDPSGVGAGEAVRGEMLSPDEQAVLRRYFR